MAKCRPKIVYTGTQEQETWKWSQWSPSALLAVSMHVTGKEGNRRRSRRVRFCIGVKTPGRRRWFKGCERLWGRDRQGGRDHIGDVTSKRGATGRGRDRKGDVIKQDSHLG